MGGVFLDHLFRDKEAEDFLEGRETKGCTCSRDDGDRAAEHSDPGVVHCVTQAIERFAEREVADDVEGSPVVPIC